MGGWVNLLWDQINVVLDIPHMWQFIWKLIINYSLKFFQHQLYLLKNFNCRAGFFFDYQGKLLLCLLGLHQELTSVVLWI